MADDFRYHIDHHGSLVRPPGLLAARAAGDPAALAAAEEEAIIAAAHLQRRLTLSAVGDGQFRREHFESVVYDHVEGFRPASGPQPLADARILADGARARALELGKALSIAVVDYGGFVVLVERMDGARPMTPSIALSKAYSAAVMQRPTVMLENWRNSDPVFFTQVGRMGQHPIVATKGGYTIKRDGEILGGLGISGGSPDEDQKICEDVLRAAGFELDFPEWAGARRH